MKTKLEFDPSKDIPSLTDQVFFITGGTTGLGKEAILALARHGPKHIYFTGRNSTNAADVVSQTKAINLKVEVSFLQCDQTSLASVENAVKKFLASSERLDVMLCNAGVMGTNPALTKDGYEQQFGINHLAHALMIKMLVPSLQRTAAQTDTARIIFLSSIGFRWTPSGGIVFKELKTTQDYWFAGRWVRYGQSKLANVIYGAELARRYPEITTVSLHPGVIFTDLWNTDLSLLNRIFVYVATLGQSIPLHEGVYNQCWAATTARKNISSGAFYEPIGVIGKQTKDSKNGDLGKQLWTWTQQELHGRGE